MEERNKQDILNEIEETVASFLTSVLEEMNKNKKEEPKKETPVKPETKPDQETCCKKVTVGEALESIKKRLLVLEASSDVDLKYIADLKADTVKLEERIDDIEDRLTSLEDAKEATNITVNSLIDRTDDLTDRVDGAEDDIEALYDILFPEEEEKEPEKTPEKTPDVTVLGVGITTSDIEDIVTQVVKHFLHS